MTYTIARRSFYLVLCATAAVMFAGWWMGNAAHLTNAANQLIALGRLAGMLATLSVLLEVFLVARLPFLERAFDLQDIADLHRWNGYVLLLSISAHVIFLVLGYAAQLHVGWWAQFADFNTNWEDVFLASIGTIAFFCGGLLSARWLRKHLIYELWYATHLVMYVAILATFLHQVKIGGDLVGQAWFAYFWWAIYLAAFAAIVYYRWLVPFLLFAKYRFTVVKVAQETPTIYSVYITGKNIGRFAFAPGQYASWRFITPNLWFEEHPYSFSYMPGGKLLRITFRVTGDVGPKLLQLLQGTPVLCSAPRGAFALERAVTNKVLLVAGGIGITPYMSAITSLLERGKKITLMYGVRDRSDIAFAMELRNLQSRGLSIEVYESGQGRRINDTALAPHIAGNPTVFICGPDKMARSIAKTVHALGLPKRQIIAERFAF